MNATTKRKHTYDEIVTRRHCLCPTRALWEDPTVTTTALEERRKACPLHGNDTRHELPAEFP